MASRIITKKGSGAPLASDLVHGELAVDTVNKRLYTENAGGTVIEVGTSPSTIDINAGTIDGTVIGGSTAAAITGTTITGTSFVSSGDMTFGDNDKALFGAGSDLQIYHDGSGSYIKEDGAGSLFVQTNGVGVIIEHTDGTNLLFADAGNQAVTLYNGGSAKLATTSTGIDVTGTITADGLTVDGDVLLNGDRDLHLVGLNPNLGTSFQYGEITIGSDQLGQYGNHAKIIANGNYANQSNLEFHTSNNNSSPLRMKIDLNGDISFYEDTGTSPKLQWSASAENLTVTTTSAASYIANRTGTDGAIAEFQKDGTAVGSIGTNGGLPYFAGTSIGLKISETQIRPSNSTGANNDNAVDLGKSDTRFKDLYLSGAVNAAQVNLADAGGTLRNVLDLDGSSNLQVGTGSSVGTRAITFFTENSEQMRLDSSGNLLVGTTGVPNGTSVYGAGFINTGASGLVQWASGVSTATGVSVARFYNPNGNVGSIQLSGTATSYVTSSDQRLKENITDANDAGDKIDAIKVRQYDWKADGSHQDYGMVAQELMTVAPEAVTGDPESDEMMGVDYSKLVPMLIKEIQSLRARVAQLEGAN